MARAWCNDSRGCVYVAGGLLKIFFACHLKWHCKEHHTLATEVVIGQWLRRQWPAMEVVEHGRGTM